MSSGWFWNAETIFRNVSACLWKQCLTKTTDWFRLPSYQSKYFFTWVGAFYKISFNFLKVVGFRKTITIQKGFLTGHSSIFKLFVRILMAPMHQLLLLNLNQLGIRILVFRRPFSLILGSQSWWTEVIKKTILMVILLSLQKIFPKLPSSYSFWFI